MYVGDLNGRNVLFDSQKRVYFIDFDGMGIDELAPEYFTGLYMDPVSIEQDTISSKDDWYSFAIQAFYYLTYAHPFGGIYYYSKGAIMDETERMKSKISILGNHGVMQPVGTESWNWMTEELQKAFLDTFEGDKRESIVPLLQEQYQKLCEEEILKN